MKDNRLIAEFMELPTEVFKSGKLNYNHNDSWFEEHELSYNVSWDWLMPVAHEILLSRDEQNADWDLTELTYALTTTNMELIYNAVVEFIKEYNTQVIGSFDSNGDLI